MFSGESGLGKSTLINSLFLTELYSPEYPGPSHRIKKTVQVEQSKVLIKEGGVQLLLTIVDTPGFGDAVDNSNCWQPVIDYIDSKFEDYLNAESRVNRRQMPDNRVQCCLYFIAPSGHGLKPLDIEFMKRLHEKVNIIPLIAKADTLTPEECQQFKKQIMKEIQEHKIKIYEFPETDDEEENKIVKKIKDRLPLAVVGSNTIIEVNGKRVRGRQYPWGVAEVENGEHCDFTILRNMLIRTHMQDLKDVTNNVHYENYRSRKLAAVTYNGVDNNKNKGQLTKSPLAQMEEERREHVAKMKKMEMEMEQVFEMKVKEKVQKLKDSEAELQRRHEQMKKNLEAQHKELEEKRRQFEDEKANWEAQQRILEQQNSSSEQEDDEAKPLRNCCAGQAEFSPPELLFMAVLQLSASFLQMLGTGTTQLSCLRLALACRERCPDAEFKDEMACSNPHVSTSDVSWSHAGKELQSHPNKTCSIWEIIGPRDQLLGEGRSMPTL
ncbi:Septin-7 [Pitangus sulphuratus]|nr:Septin-7 [Pitangus sulphuratus]